MYGPCVVPPLDLGNIVDVSGWNASSCCPLCSKLIVVIGSPGVVLASRAAAKSKYTGYTQPVEVVTAIGWLLIIF